MKKIHLVKILIFTVLLCVWFYWDFSQANILRQLSSIYRSYKKLSEFTLIKSDTVKVAIVRSDDSELVNPVPVDEENLTYEQIEDMVRRAVDLCDGLSTLIKPGDMVLIKPNIVDPEPPGSGEVTDVRVVKALIKIVDEVSPGEIEIVIGEGAPRPMDYEMDYQSKFSSPVWEELWDAAGYQDLLTDPYLAGITFRFSNLNGSPPENPWNDLLEVEVPGGGEALPQGGKYFIHKDVVNADVYITVPVMKIHEPGITVALKNQIGLAPSTIYGFSKTAGVPQNNYQYKLLHGSQAPRWWTDKEIVDLCQLARIKFTVVDALACLERQKTAIRQGGVITNLVRMNTIVAGQDPVAVDHVCTRLMGLNPDDIEHITLAEKVGLGTNNADNINVVGATIEQTMRRFIKNGTSSGDFGQSNRIWLINGPYPANDISEPIEEEFILNEADQSPFPGINGWSEAIYFTDDRINLGDYFNTEEPVVSYAFTYFDVPQAQSAQIWLGSDEAMKIYLNGEAVYTYSYTRSFSNNEFYTTRVNVNLQAGENRLLVKTYQNYGRYDFSLNICEIESDPNYDGNRVWNLKFKTIPDNPTFVNEYNPSLPTMVKLYDNYPNPFNGYTKIAYDLVSPVTVSLAIFDIRGKRIKKIINQQKQNAGSHSYWWNGTDERGNSVSSGIYVYRLQTGSETLTKKLTLIK